MYKSYKKNVLIDENEPAEELDGLFDENEAAENLDVAVQTLRNWRYQRKGPSYYKIGSAVRYGPKQLAEYRKRNLVVHNMD